MFNETKFAGYLGIHIYIRNIMSANLFLQDFLKREKCIPTALRIFVLISIWSKKIHFPRKFKQNLIGYSLGFYFRKFQIILNKVSTVGLF